MLNMTSFNELYNKTPENLKRKIEYQMVGTKPEGKLIFGSGIVKDLGIIVKEFNVKSAIIVSDKTLKELGIISLIEELLKIEDIDVDVFSEVEPEPSSVTAEKVSSLVKNNGYDMVFGLGGGSVLDVAKIAAVVGSNSGKVEEYLKGKEIKNNRLPLVLIPTTSGTGSEVSPYVVCSVGKQKYYSSDPQYFADIALIDPLLTATMPGKVTAYTGLDALSHAIEGMTSKASTPISESFGLKSVKYVLNYLERAYKDKEDLEARYYMSWASTLGMLAYVNVGGLYAHSFSYIMTSLKEFPHGLGCGYSLPHTLLYNIDYIKGILSEISMLMGYATKDMSEKEAAMETINAIQELVEKVGVSRGLCDYDIEKHELVTCADELVNKYHRANNPRDLDMKDAETILDNMWKGELKEV